MAGRGCTIQVKLLGGAGDQEQVEEISLPVALHSPLSVLKEQLEELTGIPQANQVLILCDLSDPDRNSDVLLSGRDFESLRDCGMRSGSVLTLHALGLSAEAQQRMKTQAFASEAVLGDGESESFAVLETYVPAAEADHSYNGIVFDLESKGPHEVEIVSVFLAGMLGHIRIFARDRGWECDTARRQSNHWWAHHHSLSPEGWECVADVNCRPSWDKPLEIKLNKPVKLMPHQRRALYCHSALQDDLGIQYQSFSVSDVVAEDSVLRVLPGLGHTGSEPFDDVNGWYRSYRGLAGSLKYRSLRKGWTPFEHQVFPVPLREAVRTMLLCQQREMHALARLPVHVLYNIMEFMHFDWFAELAPVPEPSMEIDSRTKTIIALRFIQRIAHRFGGLSASSLPQMLASLSGIEVDGVVLTSQDFVNAIQTFMSYEYEMDEEDDDEMDGEAEEEDEDGEEDEGEEDEGDEEEEDDHHHDDEDDLDEVGDEDDLFDDDVDVDDFDEDDQDNMDDFGDFEDVDNL